MWIGIHLGAGFPTFVLTESTEFHFGANGAPLSFRFRRIISQDYRKRPPDHLLRFQWEQSEAEIGMFATNDVRATQRLMKCRNCFFHWRKDTNF